MANHKSAKKRHRQNLIRRAGNRDVRAACRTTLKKTRLAVEAGNTAEAETLLREAQKATASAAAKGVYHKRNASRKISRLAKAVAKAKA